MTDKITRDESNDVGVHISMLTSLECKPWVALTKDDRWHARYVPYCDFEQLAMERDSILLKLTNRDAEIVDLKRDLIAARNEESRDGSIFGFSKT